MYCFISFFLYIKMTNNYYQEYKEKLRKGAHERYQNLSEEEKDTRLETDIKIFLKKKKKKKRQYNRRRNKNIFEEQKQKQAGYMSSYYLTI